MKEERRKDFFIFFICCDTHPTHTNTHKREKVKEGGGKQPRREREKEKEEEITFNTNETDAFQHFLKRKKQFFFFAREDGCEEENLGNEKMLKKEVKK